MKKLLQLETKSGYQGANFWLNLNGRNEDFGKQSFWVALQNVRFKVFENENWTKRKWK